MNRIYVPSAGPDTWQGLLAEPEKHWRTGYSARTLAHAWESSNGLPPEIARLFSQPTTLLLAIPEHKVALPGGRRESQTDLFALIRIGDRTSTLAVEGKVNEPFGPTIEEWYKDPSEGKQTRIAYLCSLLGFPETPLGSVRYQLLHRTASALIEADRFKTDEAAMIVHSFSAERMWFEDFANFATLFGASIEPDRLCSVKLSSNRTLHLGWATGDSKHLSA